MFNFLNLSSSSSRKEGQLLCTVLFSLIIMLSLVSKVSTYSVSVPPTPSVCSSMVPGHDKYRPQVTISPFVVGTDRAEVPAGGFVRVILQSLGNRTFQGYYLQARCETGIPVGIFSPTALTKVHNCHGARFNAAHHANPEEKNSIVVSWQAPRNFCGEVRFTATFVENYVTFWTRVKAPKVQVIA